MNPQITTRQIPFRWPVPEGVRVETTEGKEATQLHLFNAPKSDYPLVGVVNNGTLSWTLEGQWGKNGKSEYDLRLTSPQVELPEGKTWHLPSGQVLEDYFMAGFRPLCVGELRMEGYERMYKTWGYGGNDGDEVTVGCVPLRTLITTPFNFPALEWPELPEGEVYHNPNNVTPEQMGEGFRPMTKTELDGRYGEGKPVHPEWWSGGEWILNSSRASCIVNTYRIPASTPFPEVRKEPVMVPLGPEDFTPGCVIKDNPDRTTWRMVVAISEYEAYYGADVPSETFGHLHEGKYLISRDSGRTWEACSKPAKE